MINVKDEVYAALAAIFDNVSDAYPRDWGTLPAVPVSYTHLLMEISQIVANLWGKVSKKTLLSQVPFIENVDAEVKAVEKEAEEVVKQQQAMFGLSSNTPPDDEDEIDE